MLISNYSPEKRSAMAAALGIDEQYLYQVLTGRRTPKPALARRIHQLDNEISLEALRPEDWMEIWPEYKSSKKSAIQG